MDRESRIQAWGKKCAREALQDQHDGHWWFKLHLAQFVAQLFPLQIAAVRLAFTRVRETATHRALREAQ